MKEHDIQLAGTKLRLLNDIEIEAVSGGQINMGFFGTYKAQNGCVMWGWRDDDTGVFIVYTQCGTP